jgi:ABC-type multidrug transport system fused ATPase/permease subunit
MELDACRIHVLRRFRYFEWLLAILLLDAILLYYQGWASSALALIAISTIFGVVAKNNRFHDGLYKDLQRNDVRVLINRRYSDLLKYLTLMALTVCCLAIHLTGGLLLGSLIFIIFSGISYCTGLFYLITSLGYIAGLIIYIFLILPLLAAVIAIIFKIVFSKYKRAITNASILVDKLWYFNKLAGRHIESMGKLHSKSI